MYHEETPLVIETIKFTTESLAFQKQALKWCSFHFRYKTSLVKLPYGFLMFSGRRERKGALGTNGLSQRSIQDPFKDLQWNLFQKIVHNVHLKPLTIPAKLDWVQNVPLQADTTQFLKYKEISP